MNQEKDRIVYYIFEFLETGKRENIVYAKEWLHKLAKRYNMKIRKQSKLKIDLKTAFKEFILNGKGCTLTIPQLYNSL